MKDVDFKESLHAKTTQSVGAALTIHMLCKINSSINTEMMFAAACLGLLTPFAFPL